MRESFEKLMEGINSCIDQAFKRISWGRLKEMDAEEFAFMQSAMRLMDETKQLMRKTIENLEEKDKKLDDILRLLEKNRQDEVLTLNSIQRELHTLTGGHFEKGVED
jgi:hypothetical protein